MTHGPSAPSPPTTDLDEFRLIRVLGRGGMGAVYLAHDTMLDRAVALKLMRVGASEEHRVRFLTEARALARLRHPNVVSIYRAGLSSSGEPYLVQELVGGGSMDHLPLPVPPRRALELAVGIARGLASAHRSGVLHRDIKPSNIMVDELGTPRLLDFGLAKLTGSLAATAALGPEISGSWATERHESATAHDVAATAPARRLPGPAEAAQPAAHVAHEPPGDDRRGADPLAVTADRPVREADELDVDLARGSSANDDTSDGTILGTPRYMAPEVWRGEPATAKSDLYSFGVVLYELLSGAVPFPQAEREALREAVLGDAPAPSLAGRIAGAPEELLALVARCLERDPAARPTSADLVLYELERIASGAPPIPDGCPYRGLLPFEAEQRALFFGRGADVAAIVDRLRAEGVVVVAGDSGLGKSSLCRAGVLPAVVAGALGRARAWRVATCTPGPRGYAALTEALGLPPGGAATEAAAALARHAADDEAGGLVVLLDQAEELVTSSSAAEAADATALIAAIADGIPGVKLVIAVRGDFLTRVAALPHLRGAMTRSLHLVRGLTAEDARAIVVEPARLKGVRFESEEMIDALVAPIIERPAALPLLQFALAELWAHRDAQRAVIPARALGEIGGVSGALAAHADRVITSLAGPQRAAARRVLLALVSGEGTRQSRALGELAGGDAAASAALEALVRGRLIAARDVADGEPRYELAHESLLAAWGTLRGWLDEVVGERGVRARLAAAAGEWHRLGLRRDLLWRRAQLAETAKLVDLPAGERAFLRASRRAARSRRLFAVAIAAALPAIAGASWWSASAREEAKRAEAVSVRRAGAAEAMSAARSALTDARGLRATAVAMFRAAAAPRPIPSAPQTAASLAERAHLAERDALWSRAQVRFGDARVAMREASRQLESALLFGAARRQVTRELADVVAEQLELADLLGEKDAIADFEARLAEYDDGARLRRWRSPIAVTVAAPGATRLSLERYRPDPSGRLVAEPVLEAPSADLRAQVAPGSYRVIAEGPGIEPVIAPFVVLRRAPVAIELAVPAPGSVPPGFAYIPRGVFLHGLDDHRQPDLTWVRQNFFRAPPLHEQELGAYLIGKHEVTFAQYLRFLRALPEAARARHRQAGDPSQERTVRLDGDGRGPFTLTLRPLGVAYSAREGEPLVVAARRERQAITWEQTPVVGVDRRDAEAFATWLHDTGQLVGARLCRPLEWERAARGADGRRFPHGDTLRPNEANIDETYRREAMSPDTVGSYPASASPFGLWDMAGNAYEMVADGPTELSMRGGSWWSGPTSAATMNVASIQATRRDVYIGFRLCADWPATAKAPPSR